ncbi:hypothetical protein IPF89_00910 [Candidatus Saccharibacteria bacterium]|nr:MAG: hypothetical protein IPF89_00910 [Candidatus Saccharibacteria bacterium]
MLSYLQYFNQPVGVWNTAKLTDVNNMFQTSHRLTSRSETGMLQASPTPQIS